MTHIILLGDSSFDNGPYVDSDPDVSAHLRGLLPPGGRVTLLAVDGATSPSVPGQAAAIPADATHLVLSVGGNDALMRVDVLETPVASSGEAFLLLAAAVSDFERSYRAVVTAVLARGLPLVVCAIYNASFPEADYQRCVQVAVAAYDDVIIRVATEHRLPVIDLRAICSDPADYVFDIEPSAAGGARIAAAVFRAVTQPDAPGARIFGAA